ncbi:TPA: thioredoxin [Burkholderia cenocepacia]|nr:thioredoxin [Burkholderia cenocepacia]HDR9888542.1 thioredoxin [Burkholderia cenocepacia]
MTLTTTTEITFDTDLQGELPVLVQFTAPWCGPCKQIAPHLERLASDLTGRLKVLKVDVDESRALAKRFGVRGIPKMIFFVKGQEYARLNERFTMRMRVQIEKWFEELGLVAIDAQPSADVRKPAIETPFPWRAFGADPAVKTACLTRLQEADDENLNSGCLAGGPDQFEAVVGAPVAFAKLLDAIIAGFHEWGGEAGSAQVRLYLVKWVEAIPVGAGLGDAAPALLYDLVFGAQGSITPTSLASDVERDLFARISVLHARERAGEPVARAQWDELQRAAIQVSNVKTFPYYALELLAAPVAEWLLDLRTVLKYVRFLVPGAWLDQTPADRDKQRAADIAVFEQLKKEFGPPPEKGNTPEEEGAREKWFAQRRERSAALRKRQREADPVFWALFDAIDAHNVSHGLRFYTSLADRLLEQLSSPAH